MVDKEILLKIKKYGLFLGVPAAAVITAAFLPLRPLVREGMVGVILIWLNAGLLFGNIGG